MAGPTMNQMELLSVKVVRALRRKLSMLVEAWEDAVRSAVVPADSLSCKNVSEILKSWKLDDV